MKKTYDVVVVGAGSAGCVLAGQLVRRGVSVLLVEAGGPIDAYPQIHDPNQINCLYNLPEIHWGYKSTPQPMLDDRALDVWRAKVMGGCTSHNDMVYTRGAPGDFDAWATHFGCRGWDYASVAPHFAAVEAELQPSTTLLNDFGSAFMETCVELGIPRNPDYNSGASMRGVSMLQSTIAYGPSFSDPTRVTSFGCYVKPFIGSPHLDVLPDVLVTRVTVEDGSRAAGIEYVTPNGDVANVRASEVVLCAGAINSPKLLMLSGIGSAEALSANGIPVVVDLPSVGANMENAIIFKSTWKSAQPILAQPANEGCAIVWENLVDDEQPTTCLEMMRGKYMCDQSPEQLQGFYGVTGGAMRLQSRGVVSLASTDPAAAPIIDHRLLTAPGDYDQCVAAYDLMMRVGNSEGLAAWRAEQIDPPVGTTSPAQVEAWLKRNIYTYSHPVGTCAMGTGPDAVVDAETLQVRGVAGLRVADVSIMPRITSGHTQGPAFMIGSKAAEIMG